MMSLRTIQLMSERRAELDAKEHLTPFIVEREDIDGWRAQCRAGRKPKLPFPVLGRFVPAGWTIVNTYHVDRSARGKEKPGALTVRRFIDLLEPGHGYGIQEIDGRRIFIIELERAPWRKACLA